nr:retrovirus-related Pol polyprotein from transposon TNT 1-94 [Tanacetum cinerariifolium]
MCHIIGIEPQFENIIKNGPFIPMVAGQRKLEGQLTADERKAANLYQRLKSLIMSVLPDDQMNSVINCLTAKSTWDDLILYHKGPSDVKESRVMDLKLCYNTFKFKEGEYLTQTFSRYKALMNELDFQESPDDKEDTRSSHAYLNDLEKEYQARALLAKSKSLFKKGTQRLSSAKVTDQTKCHKCGKKEKVSSDDNEMVEVKVLMALAEENDDVSKDGAKNGEWVKISMRKFMAKDLVFVKSSADVTKVTIPGVKRPWLSKAEGFIMPNHDTGRILPPESQSNTTDSSVAITDSSVTDYDLADESSVCSTPLPPLKKLDGAEPISGPKTIKLILRSNSTFKVEAFKGIIINEPSSAPAKDNKSSSASKVDSASAGKLKSVKIKDDTSINYCNERA